MKVALKSAVLAAVLVAFASLPTPAAIMTVGDFVSATAERIGVTPATVEGMRAAGYPVPEMSWTSRVTEADVVTLANAIGVPMQTQTPRVELTTRRAERMLAYIATQTTSQQNTRGNGGGEGDHDDPRQRPRSRSPRAPHNPHNPH